MTERNDYMSYLDDFEHSFMQRTLEILRSYEGHFDATMLINCLLGLLVVPKEQFLEAIPLDPLHGLSKWGIRPASIKRIGRKTPKNPNPDTLRGIVYNLRNSVAHFRLKPNPSPQEVHSFEFTDRDKEGPHFRAVIKLHEMRNFVERLAAHLEDK